MWTRHVRTQQSVPRQMRAAEGTELEVQILALVNPLARVLAPRERDSVCLRSRGATVLLSIALMHARLQFANERHAMCRRSTSHAFRRSAEGPHSDPATLVDMTLRHAPDPASPTGTSCVYEAHDLGRDGHCPEDAQDVHRHALPMAFQTPRCDKCALLGCTPLAATHRVGGRCPGKITPPPINLHDAMSPQTSW